ncbi:MAG: hypothetical protein HYY06_06570 [Deltaproteobacteria bacterium]|nr:hypothetical protein [Deltaproteobacteria bacterium]
MKPNTNESSRLRSSTLRRPGISSGPTLALAALMLAGLVSPSCKLGADGTPRRGRRAPAISVALPGRLAMRGAAADSNDADAGQDARPDGGRGSGGAADPAIDQCLTNNGGCDPLVSCTMTASGRRCGPCPEGYSGSGETGCVDIDECLTDNGGCDPRVACENTSGGRRCGPPRRGYSNRGVREIADVDECLTNNGGCDPLVACTNTPDGRRCGPCPAGYAGGGETGCVDVDECLTNNGGCDPLVACANTDGGRTCGPCPAGYAGGGETGCANVDECQVDHGGCDPQVVCENTPGGRLCGSCPAGFYGSGETGCADIDECRIDNGGCDPRDMCVNMPGGLRCVTPPEVEPTQIVDGVDECSLGIASCGAGSTCADDSVGYHCECEDGFAPTADRACAAAAGPDCHSLVGRVAGLAGAAAVTLGSDGYLSSLPVGADGAFAFFGVPPGAHFLKLEATGHESELARTIVVPDDAAACARSIVVPDMQARPLEQGDFCFHWEEDVSRSGYQVSAWVNEPARIAFLGEPVDSPDLMAADALRRDFQILLSDEELAWTQEHAYRLHQTMKTIPQLVEGPSKWVLTSEHLPDDIIIDHEENLVVISQDAFVYAAPRLVLLDGLRGTFYSKRLHHAATMFVTHEGESLDAVERILGQRFGVTTVIGDYRALTDEHADRFQEFHPDELLDIIDMFEEMPAGYRVVPGLSYLVRRKDGQPHPLYPGAPAVAWPTRHVESYIEFMDTAFLSNLDHMHRLIIHEKSHFLWSRLFTEELKQAWIEVGQWYQNPDDPSGWSTRSTTEFVSAYAHLVNPDEDMAESLSYFILDPGALQSRSLPKYEFIRDRIMHGDRYVQTVREDLTFQVLNLYPDYAYPGKIRRVDVCVEGEPEADKTVTVEIELHTMEGVLDGASNAFLRLSSEANTHTDMYLSPANERGSVLRGAKRLSRYSKAGLWFTDQIVVVDSVGNQRLEGVDDFGWRMYVNNPLEDLTPPRYVPGSIAIQRSDDVLVQGGIDHDIQRVRVTWAVEEDVSMGSGNPSYATLINPSAGIYRMESYGSFDAATSTATVDFLIKEFNASGDYEVSYISMADEALNSSGQRFSDAPEDEPAPTVTIVTPNPDATGPELELNDIDVSAAPTRPDAPNGETLVQIDYRARDDASGLGVVGYLLLDPQGLSHGQYHYHRNFYTEFFDGDPTAWEDYEIDVVLPVGSAPGTWGLQLMELSDKAGNRTSYDFTEIIHFEVAE